jgi:hypothetical protein
MTEAEEHLGDGLYASFDAGMIRLRADGREHVVYLEPMAFMNFIEWAKRVPGWEVTKCGRVVIRKRAADTTFVPIDGERE